MGARIAWQNLLTASGVVISSSSEATGYVDDNLANPLRWKKWRSATQNADQWVKFDLGANKNFQVIAGMNAKLHSSGGTLKAQANATDVWTTPTVNDTLSVPSPDLTKVLADWLGSVQNLRWIRYYFTDVGGVSDYVELGAVFAGTYLEPTRSVSDGVSITRIDPSVQRVAIGGQRSAVIRPKYHRATGRFDVQTASARDDLRTLYETVGAAVPAIFTVDPSSPSLTLYGTLQASLDATDSSPNLWRVPIDFTEDVA